MYVQMGHYDYIHLRTVLLLGAALCYFGQVMVSIDQSTDASLGISRSVTRISMSIRESNRTRCNLQDAMLEER